MASSSSDCMIIDEKSKAPELVLDDTYILMCIGGTIKVSNTRLQLFEFFVNSMQELDPQKTKRIDILDKYNDVAALFIYIYKKTFEKKEIPAILTLLDKWGGPITLATELFRSIEDVKFVPNCESKYITKVLTEFCKANNLKRITEEILDLPDHVVGKLAKVMHHDVISQSPVPEPPSFESFMAPGVTHANGFAFGAANGFGNLSA